MKDLLMSQTTKENTRLNHYGDTLVKLHKKLKDKTILYYLDIQFNNLQEILSNIDVAILNCYGNNELLIELIPYLNDASFMIASFAGSIMELEEEM